RHPSPSHTYPLSLHDALPIFGRLGGRDLAAVPVADEDLRDRGERRDRKRDRERRALVAAPAAAEPAEGVGAGEDEAGHHVAGQVDRKSTRLNSSHVAISYAVF